jgi:hypothetical protein
MPATSTGANHLYSRLEPELRRRQRARDAPSLEVSKLRCAECGREPRDDEAAKTSGERAQTA